MHGLPDPALLIAPHARDFAMQPVVRLRRLAPEDRAALAAHLIALPPFDRVARWNGARSDAAIRGDCEALDLEAPGGRAKAMGAFAGDILLGAAIGIRLPRGILEVAVSVDAGWRRQGIGTALVALLWQAARDEEPVAEAVLLFEQENIPIQGLARKLGGRVDPLRGEARLGAPAG